MRDAPWSDHLREGKREKEKVNEEENQHRPNPNHNSLNHIKCRWLSAVWCSCREWASYTGFCVVTDLHQRHSVRAPCSLTWQDVDVSVLFFILLLGGSVTWCLYGADWQCLNTGKATFRYQESERTDAFQSLTSLCNRANYFHIYKSHHKSGVWNNSI